MSRALLKQALDMLNDIAIETGDKKIKAFCIDIMSELAKPEAELKPLAESIISDLHSYYDSSGMTDDDGLPVIFLDDAIEAVEEAESRHNPPLKQPLSDDEILNIWKNSPINLYDYARNIERAHGITVKGE